MTSEMAALVQRGPAASAARRRRGSASINGSLCDPLVASDGLIQPDSVNASATSVSAGGSVHGTTVSEEYEAVEAVDMEAAPVEEAAAPEPLGAAGL